MGRWGALALLIAGCGFETRLTPCGELLCAPDAVCIRETYCASQSAIAACAGLDDGEPCTTSVFTGTCTDGACSGDDADSDGVRNDRDNCPFAANPTQSDRDGDGVGDACDGCPDLATARQHDEDGDRIGDECDLCPAFADFGLDTDGDGAGDACDAGPARILFDPFLSLAPAWEPSAVAWMPLGDSIAPTAAMSTTDAGLQRPSLLLTGKTTIAVMAMFSQRPWQDGDHAGVQLRDSGGPLVRCDLHCASGSCQLIVAAAAMTRVFGDVAPTPALSLGVAITHQRTGGGTLYSCILSMSTFQVIRDIEIDGQAPFAVWPSMISQPGHEVTSFEAYAGELD